MFFHVKNKSISIVGVNATRTTVLHLMQLCNLTEQNRYQLLSVTYNTYLFNCLSNWTPTHSSRFRNSISLFVRHLHHTPIIRLKPTTLRPFSTLTFVHFKSVTLEGLQTQVLVHNVRSNIRQKKRQLFVKMCLMRSWYQY